jgi:hypothetical protein
MLLFVPPWSVEGYGESPYDPSDFSHLLAVFIMIVSVGALTITLCRALLMLLMGVPVELLGGFGPPPSQHFMLSI